MVNKRIAYCTPSLYIAGGIERVLTTKMNYLADVAGYDVWVVLTDGKGKEPYFPLSDKIHVVNLDINFEEVWHHGFLGKIPVYLKKQVSYRRKLKQALVKIKPDITVTTLRREINFITSLNDGSKKVGEMHINRSHYRNFEGNDSNAVKKVFAKVWMRSLVRKLKKLDSFVVLTDEDKNNWKELDNVVAIPNPLNVPPSIESTLHNKKVVAAGRYCHEKGFDLLLQAWAMVAKRHPDWKLEIYGGGNSEDYKRMAVECGVGDSASINPATNNIYEKFADASIFVLSSRFEGFGLVLIEAMATKLPVVSFACPYGPRAIVSDGEDGFLVENGNVPLLADKICYLIEHEDARLRMGEKAKLKASHYRVDNIMCRWIDLFDGL